MLGIVVSVIADNAGIEKNQLTFTLNPVVQRTEHRYHEQRSFYCSAWQQTESGQNLNKAICFFKA